MDDGREGSYLAAGWERDRVVRGKLYLFAPPRAAVVGLDPALGWTP